MTNTERTRLWQEKNQEKVIAHRIFHNAMDRGEISRPSECSHCGKESRKINGHHFDYSRPLDVKWLCYSCHKREHLSMQDKCQSR